MNLHRAASLMECQYKQRVRNHKPRKEFHKKHVQLVAEILRKEIISSRFRRCLHCYNSAYFITQVVDEGLMNQITAAARAAGVPTDTVNREKDDFYPTPPEAVEALLSKETFTGPIWEPACGDGAISKVLKQHGHHVESTDLVDRGYGVPRIDFLMEYKSLCPNIITNPPYKYCTEFAWKALEIAESKVAFLCRLQFLESLSRRALFEKHSPSAVWVFSERLRMQKGRQANDTDASGMVAFAWFVWDKAHKGPTQLGWI